MTLPHVYLPAPFNVPISGPAHWAKEYPQASGHRQSPVDITPSSAKKGSELNVAPLKWKYVPEHTKSLVNPGKKFKVNVLYSTEILTLTIC